MSFASCDESMDLKMYEPVPVSFCLTSLTPHWPKSLHYLLSECDMNNLAFKV